MKLWLISQDENTGYDTYDGAVVAAETEDEARMIIPGGDTWDDPIRYSWCSTPDKVTVKLIGVAEPGTPAGVVLSSFNAG